jgi:GGDEF domain-containing protein
MTLSVLTEVETPTLEGRVDSTDDRPLRRLMATVQALIERAQVGRERELVTTIVQAIAIWYDLDVRAYRQAVDGHFVLDIWLSGTELPLVPRVFTAPPMGTETDVLQISSLTEQEQLGWQGLSGELILLPIAANLQAPPVWILTITDLRDSKVPAPILMLCRILGILLEQLTIRRAVELRERVMRRLMQQGESFNALVAGLLDELMFTVQAAEGRLFVKLDAGLQAMAAKGKSWESAPHPETIVGTPALASTYMSLATPVGAGGVFVLEVRATEEQAFTVSHARLMEAAMAILRIWGAGVTRGAASVSGERTLSRQPMFEQRIEEEISRAKRFKLELGLLLFHVPPGVEGAAAAATTIREVPKAIQRQLRRSDVLGWLAGGELAAVLVHTGAKGVNSAGARLQRSLDAIARSLALPALRVGYASFPGDAETPVELFERARR